MTIVSWNVDDDVLKKFRRQTVTVNRSAILTDILTHVMEDESFMKSLVEKHKKKIES